MHVALGPVVAAGLALRRLAVLLRLSLLFGLGRRGRRFLDFRLVLHHLGEATHLALRFRKAVVAVFQQGLQIGYGLLHAFYRRVQFRNGCIQVGYGHAQLAVGGIGGLQLTLKHFYDHVLSHIRNEAPGLVYKYRSFCRDFQIQHIEHQCFGCCF